MDPLTISLAVGVASKAFSALKEGFAIGRDLEQMSGDLNRWMGASSDIDNADKQAKNPGIFGKVFGAGSIESTALQAYSAKKKSTNEADEYSVKKPATKVDSSSGKSKGSLLVSAKAEIKKITNIGSKGIANHTVC